VTKYLWSRPSACDWISSRLLTVAARKGANLASTALMAAMLALPLASGQVPAGKPEEAGMSTERLQRIHQAMERHIDAEEISGAVTLVARHGKIVHFQAHGLMDLESKKAMTTDAIFRIASMTKPITGVAVMMMVEEGKIRLTDPVSKFIPEFKDTKVAVLIDSITPRPSGQRSGGPDFYLVPAYREITVRDLLTHTSGLMSGGIGAREGLKSTPKTATDTLATYVPKLGSVALDFQPGTDWAYSGSAGPEVLGRIVEIVSGEPYDQFLRTRIFEPLGMKDTFFYPPDDRRPRLVTLYDKSPEGLRKSANQDGVSSKTYSGAGGGLMSTAEDYLQFAQMLGNGGKLNGHVLLSPRTVQLMASNHVGDMFNGKLGRPAHGMGYGLLMGIVENSVASGLRVSTGSFGWDGLYGTQAWINPTEKMVTIIMIQTQVTQVQRDFENAVMQAIME
jgi:CubicO group peptidase (beta-lactamase class C family)